MWWTVALDCLGSTSVDNQCTGDEDILVFHAEWKNKFRKLSSGIVQTVFKKKHKRIVSNRMKIARITIHLIK